MREAILKNVDESPEFQKIVLDLVQEAADKDVI